MAFKMNTGLAAQVAYRVAKLPPVAGRIGGQGLGGGAMKSTGPAPLAWSPQAPGPAAPFSTIGLKNQQAWLNVLGNEKAKAAQRAPAAPAAPAAPGAPAAAGGTPAPDDPLAKYKDSTYFSAIAQNIANRTNGLAGLQEGDSRLKADAGTSIERLTRNYAGQRQNLTEGANKSGLFYSGILGKRLGDAETNYTDQKGDINTALTRHLFDNEAQRKGLLEQYGNPADASDYGLSGRQLLGEAGQRYVQNNPVPPAVIGRPGENGLPQGFNQGGWGGLAPGLSIEWDPTTGKAKRIVKR